MTTVPPPGAAGGRAALTWPVRESFLGYVNRMGGRITIIGPARPGARGFSFPHALAASAPGPGEADGLGAGGGPMRELAFGGAVAFVAHGGALDVVIADPVLVFDDLGVLLTVRDSALPGSGTRAVIAELASGSPTPADGETVALVPRLTSDGSALFGGVYPAGETMDPLFVPGRLLAPGYPPASLPRFRSDGNR
jgi:hypothetical protein